MRIDAVREDGVQCGDAEFGRLLDDEIGGVALEQRECQPQIGTFGLGVCSMLNPQSGTVAPDGLDAGGEFAVAAIEQQQPVARPAPHDVGKIMHLRCRYGDGVPFAQGCRDVKTD